MLIQAKKWFLFLKEMGVETMGNTGAMCLTNPCHRLESIFSSVHIA